MTPSEDPPPTHGSHRPRVTRAAALGAIAGLLAGALYLAGLFVRAFVLPRPCGTLGAAECQFQHQAARELGRLQGAVALALLLLAFALLRSRRTGTRGPGVS